MTIGQTTDRPVPGGPERPDGARVDDVVRVALTVPGVTGVRVEPEDDGSAVVRLELVPGSDESLVAAAVEAALARDAAVGPVAGSAPGPGPVALTAPVPPAATPLVAAPVPVAAAGDDAPAAATRPRLPMPAAAPERTTERPPERPRTGRVPVPPLSSTSVAATPAPQWLGDLSPAPRAEGGERLVVERVQVSTEGLSTTATVVLVRGGAVHTGVCEAANTPAGGPRALASATLRALESAAGGRLRGEVEAVRASELDGRAAVTVMIGIASSRGSEQLVGAALEGGHQPAVVRAVLAACNRRLGPDLR